MIEILATPNGWLRVRQGPGTNYPEIAKVNSGEKFAVLEEKDGWFKIRLEEGQEGWVSSQYAQKEENFWKTLKKVDGEIILAKHKKRLKLEKPLKKRKTFVEN